MISVDFDLTIGRPPEDVFPYLEDPEKVVRWQSSVVELSQETEGPRGVGTRIRDVRKLLGRRIESTVEFTEYDPPRTLGLKMKAGPIPFRVLQTVEPVSVGCRVTVHAEGEADGVFKLGSGLAARTGERQMRGDFERLKKLLESGG